MEGEIIEVSLQEFRDVQKLVRSLCDLVLTDDKTYLVRTRLESVVQAHGFATFSEYLGRLQEFDAAQMRDELVEALTTGETSFNRDSHPFEEFRRRILPDLAAGLLRRRESSYARPLARLWSAGCSTGQEAYSLAMSILEFLSVNPSVDVRPDQFPILATDVSARSLNLAKEGRYPEREIERGLTTELRNRYFDQQDDDWTASERLRRLIDFRRLNFIDGLGNLGPFEVILCRNVMIYFDAKARQRLCDQFHRLLVPGGLLILGAAESLYGLQTPLESEQLGSTIVYRKPSIP